MVSAMMYETKMIQKILKEKTNNNLITIEKLHKIVMQEARVLNNFTIKKVIKAFELMGYIKIRMDGFFEVDIKTIEARLKEIEESG